MNEVFGPIDCEVTPTRDWEPSDLKRLAESLVKWKNGHPVPDGYAAFVNPVDIVGLFSGMEPSPIYIQIWSFDHKRAIDKLCQSIPIRLVDDIQADGVSVLPPANLV